MRDMASKFSAEHGHPLKGWIFFFNLNKSRSQGAEHWMYTNKSISIEKKKKSPKCIQNNCSKLLLFHQYSKLLLDTGFGVKIYSTALILDKCSWNTSTDQKADVLSFGFMKKMESIWWGVHSLYLNKVCCFYIFCTKSLPNIRGSFYRSSKHTVCQIRHGGGWLKGSWRCFMHWFQVI